MRQGVKTVSMNIGKCITEKESAKIPQTLDVFFRPLYMDVFKIVKIETSIAYGRRFAHYMETHRIRIYF